MSNTPDDTGNDENKEKVDPALPKKALEDLRGLLRGNGIKSESVRLKYFDGEVFNFEGFGVFKIDPVVSEKHVPGKDHGEIAGSYPDAQQKIRAALEKISRDREVRRTTIDLLKKRPDLGVLVDNQIVHLERLGKKFVIHESCSPCDATGKILCRNCQGKRQVPCHTCHGQRQVICHACHGTQFMNTSRGRQQCTQCHGRGRVNCKMCEQTGHVQCPKCKATGKMPCQTCSSTGWNSRVFHVQVKARGSFTYDRDALPQELPPLIDEYGPDLVLGDHAQVRIIEEPRRDEELDRLSKPDEYIIPYHIRLAWGDIGFMLNKSEVKAKLFGFNPVLALLPPVLEKTLTGGLQALSKASQAGSDVAGQIGKAIRYRAIGETFLAAIPNPPQRAAAMIRERYPYGLGTELIHRMVAQANGAMKHLTLKPRLQGLGIGALAVAALFALYFFGPLRALVLGQTGAAFPQIVPDIGAVLVGGGIITAAIQLTAGAALQKALGRLLEKSRNRARLKPKPAQSALWGYPAAIVLFAVIMHLSVMNGAPAPDWYRLPGAQQHQTP